MYAFTYLRSHRPASARKRVEYGHSNLGQSPQVRRILHRSTLQPKLTIGAPNDKYEQEADRVADQVMRMPEPHAHQSAPAFRETPGPVIQRCQDGHLCGT